MPKFSQFSQRQKLLKGSVFEKFMPRMQGLGDKLVRLHIGDSYRRPEYRLPVEEPFLQKHPYFNRYCNTRGIPQLRSVIAEKLSAENNLPVQVDDVMMTAGASNALNVSIMGLVDPGEEVLILTPCWPFVFGMVNLAGGVPVEIPLYVDLYDQPEMNIAALLQEAITPRTVAVYLNTPNNPSGQVLTTAQLQQVADVVVRNNLWLISDEAYDGMIFFGEKPPSVAALPGMFERTISVYSFSKTFMFAGIRLGYMAAPAEIVKELNKVLVHELYSPSTLGQQMMVQPMRERETWMASFVDECRQTATEASERLKVPHYKPRSAYYLFFSIEDVLNGRDYWAVIEACLDVGVSVAPGGDFGDGFASYIRICFAGEPPQRVLLAIDRLNSILIDR